MLTASEGAICSALIKMYNEDGIIVNRWNLGRNRPVSNGHYLTGKTIVCIVSGNNDIYRIENH